MVSAAGLCHRHSIAGSAGKGGNLGNADLKPERTTETEAGFDADLANDRLHLDVTFYSKSSRDALISRPLAPSFGVTTAQFYNLGKVSNKGVEITLSGQLARGATVWDFALSAFGNRNRLIDLGKDFLGHDIPQIIFTPQRHVEGQRIARPALVAVGGDHRHVGESGEGLAQAADAFGAKAVIVAHEDLHACAGNRPVRSGRDYIL